MGSLGVLLAYLLDLIFGDPEWFPHPARGMGRLISFLDKRLRRSAGKLTERIKGLTLAVVVVGISGSLAYLFMKFSREINPLLGSLAWVYLGYTTLSIKDLRVKAKAVLKEIENNSLMEARRQLSKIVGRDTQDLSEEKIIKATIETIAENTNDGIIAPLFYLMLGGPVLAIMYKAVNTLDSMVGYKNERYIHFGWFSAKLDDVMNFVPARITGILIGIASAACLRQGRLAMTESFKIMLRDGKKHLSPNSGISEAAMAGALGIGLGGPSTYQDKLSIKPYLGEERHPTKSLLIDEALAISFAASFLIVLLGALVKWAI